MSGRRALVLGGLGALAVAGGWWATHRAPPAPGAFPVPRHPSAPRTEAKPPEPGPGKAVSTGTPARPTQFPVPPTASTAPGDAAASFTRATGQRPALPLEVVTLPWDPQTQWAVEPALTHVGGNAQGTLWFGERTGPGPWRWIPSTLPGALDPGLPKPVSQALQWAFDLEQGEPGPQLLGRIQWAAITGHVGLPEGWTLTAAPAQASPLAAPSVLITVWEPSYTGVFSGVYGVETAWDAANAGTGQHGLAGLVAAPSLDAALSPGAP